MIYTDEDKIDERPSVNDPQFKGRWSPEMAIITTTSTISRSSRRSIVEQAGRLREGYEAPRTSTCSCAASN